MADLAVSLLSADFSCLEKQLQELKEADVKWLHIDVVLGLFHTGGGDRADGTCGSGLDPSGCDGWQFCT